MPEIVKHSPQPAPPETYDITGLSKDDLIVLRDVLGRICGGHVTHLYDVVLQEIGYGKRWYVRQASVAHDGAALVLEDLGEEKTY